jgi:hypothetical protein
MRIGSVSHSLLMLIACGTASLILAAGPARSAPCAQTDLVEFEKMTWEEVKCGQDDGAHLHRRCRATRPPER